MRSAHASSSTVSSPTGRAFLREEAERRVLFENHAAIVRRGVAEDERKERGLAGAIRADEADAILAIHLE